MAEREGKEEMRAYIVMRITLMVDYEEAEAAEEVAQVRP